MKLMDVEKPEGTCAGAQASSIMWRQPALQWGDCPDILRQGHILSLLRLWAGITAEERAERALEGGRGTLP